MHERKLKSWRLSVMLTGALIACTALFAFSPVTAMAATNSSNHEHAVSQGATSQVAPPSAGAMLFDTLVVRPVSLVATVLGAAVFVVSLPASAIGGNTGAAGHQLVVKPGAFTFDRPLGQFHDKSPY